MGNSAMLRNASRARREGTLNENSNSQLIRDALVTGKRRHDEVDSDNINM